MTYNIKLYRNFPISKQNNYALEGGAYQIYNNALYYFDSSLGERVSCTAHATFMGFAPFPLNNEISIVLPISDDDSRNIFAADDAQAINYMVVQVRSDEPSATIQYIGYFIESQTRLSNSTLRVVCSVDLLNSIDFEDYIDFKQSIFTRRHKSRIESVILPSAQGEDITCELKPIDSFPEAYSSPAIISKRTEIDPDGGLNFSMIQRAINDNDSSYPSWGIVLEPSVFDGDVVSGALVHSIGFKNVSPSTNYGGTLSIGLTKKLRQSSTVGRYVRIPYFPFDLTAKKVELAIPSGDYNIYSGFAVALQIEIPFSLPTSSFLGRNPRVIKQEPNAYTGVSNGFSYFKNQTEYDALPVADKSQASIEITQAGYRRDDAYFDYSGMIGIIDQLDLHPSSAMLTRELETLAPHALNLASGLTKLKNIGTDDFSGGEITIPKATQIIDPKINHSSISPVSLVFGANACDVPLETFEDICNDDRVVVGISYSLATPGNFTLSVKPKTGGFVETSEFYHCTFSIYPSADMQLTSDSYVSYMRDQRPFDLNIQRNLRDMVMYRQSKQILNAAFGNITESVASYGVSALAKIGMTGLDTAVYAEAIDNLNENNNARKLAAASNSVFPVITTSYDIWEGISNYHAWLIEKEPKPFFKQEILKDFYYKGYSTLERLDSLPRTRWLFDFFQGAIVVKPSLNRAAADRLIALFNEGITILHLLPQLQQFDDANYCIPDYDNGYENIETEIPVIIS